MCAVPALTPVIIPDEVPAEARAGAPDVQVPPPAASVSVVVWPMHICNVPLIAGGREFTVTIAVVPQPVAGIT
jgi:hypothetical protein